MKCRCHKPGRLGFTLAEVLAALAFMAIVIPVAVQGLQVANRAGVVSQRKMAAAHVAERMLNEAVVTGTWRDNSPSQDIQEGFQTVRVMIKSEPWMVDAMYMVTAEVYYTVQGEEFQLTLSTLVDDLQQ